MNWIKLGCAAAIVVMSGCAHQKSAMVTPKGKDRYDVIGESSIEQYAYSNAEKEAKYTCEDDSKQLFIMNYTTVFQGADKHAKDDVQGENAALAAFTGRSGKERAARDYKVTLLIECR